MRAQADNFSLGLNLVPFYVVLRETTERVLLLWKKIRFSFITVFKKTKLVQTHTSLLFFFFFLK